MTPTASLDPGFAFEGIPPVQQPVAAAQVAAAAANPPSAPGSGPLGPLAQLPGTWTGTGFNAIWRPHQPGQDRFLELNLTTEALVFSAINGNIPNRGLLMHDINMHGVTYMQQISEKNGPGLHVEPGIWAHVPATSDPQEPETVVRMASIPHGTTILAQGTSQFLQGGPPHIPDNNIIPFPIGGQPESFAQAENDFPELNLAHNTQFRHVTDNTITQNMVKNPNSILQAALQGKPMKSRTFMQITSKHQPIKGGGTSNTAFLAAGNANAVEVDATFWIQTLPGSGGGPDILQLQYTQLVILNFNGLSWPHVTVATLRKQ
jgi:hypothetical protein